MLSNKAKYGLKAMLYLAERAGEGGRLGADIAKSEHIPKKFLDFILLQLKNNNLLFSRKGRGGGYSLARPPTNISVGEIIRILDGPLALITCASQNAYAPCTDCTDPESCQIRAIMRKVRDATAEILDNTTLVDLATDRAPKMVLYYDI
jgi:Rrf2 family protein